MFCAEHAERGRMIYMRDGKREQAVSRVTCLMGLQVHELFVHSDDSMSVMSEIFSISYVTP